MKIDGLMISLGTSTRSDPTVGEIHCLQISITELFHDESNFDSCVSDQSKSSSSSSSSSKSAGRRTKRPCVIWRTHPDLQVLVMSRFAGVDVSDPSVRLFEHLPQEYVLKKLIAVYPKAPYGGRRSITAATRSSVKPIETMNTNLILMPVSIKKPKAWKVALEYFPTRELEYIAELIFQLVDEERVEQMKTIQQLNPPPPIDENEIIEQQLSTSSSSSLPTMRSQPIHSEYRKDEFIRLWLNDGKWTFLSLEYSLVFV